jgi:hypothetical protein
MHPSKRIQPLRGIDHPSANKDEFSRKLHGMSVS